MVTFEVGRDTARELARHELSKPAYHRDDPGFVQRIGEWLQARLNELVDNAGAVTPGGWFGITILVVLAVLVVVVVVRRVGGVRRDAVSSAPLMSGRIRSAAEHRAAAQSAVTDGRYDLAIRERLRALARELETRGVLDARPGRTADELARDGGAVRPDLAVALRDAALTFDDVWYGARPATPQAYAVVVRADELVTGAQIGAR